MKRLMNALIAFDQLLNTFFAGYPDETISSRSYRMQDRKKRWAVVRICVDTLFFWEPEHCKQSYESERLRRQLPPEFRTE